MGKRCVIRIDKQTKDLQAIYDDRLLPYLARLREALGLPADTMRVERASHVEPALGNAAGGNWSVDLSPVGGPSGVLADSEGRAFVTREEALDYERRWIETRCLGYGDPASPIILSKEVCHVSVEPQTG